MLALKGLSHDSDCTLCAARVTHVGEVGLRDTIV